MDEGQFILIGSSPSFVRSLARSIRRSTAPFDPPPPPHLVSVLMGLSYGPRSVLSYAKHDAKFPILQVTVQPSHKDVRLSSSNISLSIS